MNDAEQQRQIRKHPTGLAVAGARHAAEGDALVNGLGLYLAEANQAPIETTTTEVVKPPSPPPPAHRLRRIATLPDQPKVHLYANKLGSCKAADRARAHRPGRRPDRPRGHRPVQAVTRSASDPHQ